MSAPVPFIAIGAIALGIGWIVARKWDSERITYWKELVAEYKDKLDNASPEEVADRISNLESDLIKTKQTLAAITRRITRKQREQFAATAAGMARDLFATMITCNPFDAEAEGYAKQISELFRSNGFNCGFGHYQIDESLYEFPLVMVVNNPEQLTPQAQMIAKLFKESDIQFHTVKEPRAVRSDVQTLYLCVGRNLSDE